MICYGRLSDESVDAILLDPVYRIMAIRINCAYDRNIDISLAAENKIREVAGMGLLDLIFGKQKKNTAKLKPAAKWRDEPTEEEKKELEMLLNLMKSKARDCIVYTITDEPGNLFDSKIGGPYYLPLDLDVPEADGIKLSLLAQINMETQPCLPGFPKKGLLQFFAEDDDSIGLAAAVDAENRVAVRYIEHLPESGEIRTVEETPKNFPFDGTKSYRLVPHAAKSLPSCSANEYEKILKENVPELLEELSWGTGFISDYLNEAFFESMSALPEFVISGTMMGGYPDFAQWDPRKDDQYDTLLFQLDSDMKHVCWGDCGVANFFISRENLEKLDFSDVLYNWDCG